MLQPTSSPAVHAPWHPGSHDARVLAGLLRTARLSIVLSPDGVDTTPLLLHAVMPKLQRRVSDRALRGGASSGSVIGFTDRRDSQAGLLARRDREIAVFFDVWTGDPVAALLRQVQAIVDEPWMPDIDAQSDLSAMLAELQSRHNLRFLLLLDRFEDVLLHRSTHPQAERFLQQWLEAVGRTDLAAHFLVAMPESLLSLFDGLRDRIVDFDDRCLRASGPGPLFGLTSVAPPISSAAIDESVLDVTRVDAPTPTPGEDDAFMEDVSAIGLRVAASADAAPAAADQLPWPPLAPLPTPPTRPPAAAWLVLPLIALAVWWWVERDPTVRLPPLASQPPAAQVEPPPAAAAPSTESPAAIDIAVDPANGTDARIARELTTALAPGSGIALPAIVSRGGLATLVDLDAASISPRLAIASYDALQAARALPARPKLSVVTPLYTQEIYFVVRADSPLRFLHDLRGVRIDAGPAEGSRALTAAAVYRQLFGEALPASPSTARSEDDALAELLAFQSIDVLATVGGQPMPWLAQLPKATRDRIRLLKLDGRDATDRRALQTFLPSTVHGLDLGGDAPTNTPSLAVMSFLVTNAQPGDAEASTRLSGFARDLCRALPALREAGHPKWSEVNPGQSLPTGFPESAAAQAGFAECNGGTSTKPQPLPTRSTP